MPDHSALKPMPPRDQLMATLPGEPSTALRTYLQTHFVPKSEFAELCGMPESRLDSLIASGAVPEPTYICDGSHILSAVFGALPIAEKLEGEYFRPECARWARVADAAPFGSERAAVIAVLSSELATSLAHSLDDATVATEMAAALLPHFFNGTFGLCVADPSTGAGIARKEMLQDRLVVLTGNGTRIAETDADNAVLLKLIDDYACSSMPFSPVEYPRSSRKRLVDDLRLRVREQSTGESTQR